MPNYKPKPFLTAEQKRAPRRKKRQGISKRLVESVATELRQREVREKINRAFGNLIESLEENRRFYADLCVKTIGNRGDEEIRVAAFYGGVAEGFKRAMDKAQLDIATLYERGGGS